MTYPFAYRLGRLRYLILLSILGCSPPPDEPAGQSIETAAGNASALGTALFVVGSTSLSAPDAAIRSRLTGLGFTLVTKTGSAVTSGDATGKAVVVISESITSSDVNTKFRAV